MDFDDLLGDGGFGEADGGFGGEDAQANDLFMFGLNSQEIEDMKSQKDSVIFLIDCHKSMHQRNPHNGQDQDSNLQQVLKAALSFVKTKIITNENDKIGIVLYGCGSSENQKVKNQNSLNFKDVHVLYSLDAPDANLIKQLENKLTQFTQDHGFFSHPAAAPNKPVSEFDPSQINSSSVIGSSLAAANSSLNPSQQRF